MEKKFDELTFEEKLNNEIPYYIECQKWDVVTKMIPFLKAGSWYVRSDGKIAPQKKFIWDSPWCYVRSMGKACHLNHAVLFGAFKIIPQECQECWKVVIEPRTVDELFKLYRLQRELDVPSKCGTELERANSTKRYGGYFYTNSIEEGRARYTQVRKEIDEKISPDVPVILKRACTEFEQEFGDSRDWTVTPEQKEFEEIIKDSFCMDVYEAIQAKHMVMRTHMKWIHIACQWGDETYLLYTGGNKLLPDLVTYHNNEEYPNYGKKL